VTGYGLDDQGFIYR